MRVLLLIVVTAVLAWGLWSLLVADPEPPIASAPPALPPPDPEEEEPLDPRERLTTATLVVTVRTPKGEVPPDARAGYRIGGENRLRPLNAKGQARFTDAPLGRVIVVAEAPGFVEQRQPRDLIAGVRTDVYFVMQAEKRARKP